MNKPLGLLALLALAAVGHAADKTYRVTQNVGSLSKSSGTTLDPYLFLEFQLTNGGQSNADDNSTVRITNISLTGGAFDLGDRRLGDLGRVTGTDTDFTLHNVTGAAVSDRALLFRVNSANAVLAYDFTISSTRAETEIFDGFNVGMLYRTGADVEDFAPVGTAGPTGSEMVAHTFDGTTTTVPLAYGVDGTFASDRASANDLRFTELGTPRIAAVPEPATLAALSLGAAALLRRRRR